MISSRLGHAKSLPGIPPVPALVSRGRKKVLQNLDHCGVYDKVFRAVVVQVPEGKLVRMRFCSFFFKDQMRFAEGARQDPASCYAKK